MLKEVLKLFSRGKIILLIILGSISWSLTMVKSGLLYPFGLGFWGPNGHDGIWHIALANSLARGTLDIPTFAGERLKNYHIGFDLIIALINKITTIPIPTIYFQIAPPVLAVLTGIVVYKLVLLWTKSQSASFWSVFFVYFGGSFGFVLGKGESAFWSQQAISSLINPPFALSIVILSAGLFFLLKKKYILATILFGILIEIKAYAGILALGSLFVVGVLRIIKEKKLDYLLVFLGALVISVILFIPLNKNSTNLFMFQPFWFLESMMGLSDRIGWQKFYSAMTNYKTGGSWKWLPAYGVAFLIFNIGNIGTRMIKDIWIIKKLKKIKDIDYLTIFSFSVIGAGILIPTFFVQTGTPWNTIQFFYYCLFFSAILAGIAVSDILSNKSDKFIFVFSSILILITISTTVMTLKDVYLPSRPPAMISNTELEALNFLAKQENGIVLTYPYDGVKAKEAVNNPPRPLALYDSTAYVSAYSNKPTYLEDEVNLDITGYNWRERREHVFNFVNESDAKVAREFLKKNNIRYIYLVKATSPIVGEKLKLGPAQAGLEELFSNREITIYKVSNLF